jgi:hypothetical protein
MKLAVLGGVAASVLCTACSTSQMQRSAPMSPAYLEADPLTKGGVAGMPYYLPNTAVPVTIAGDFVLLPERKENKPQTAADFEYVVTVTVGAPKQVADPDAALMLEYRPEPASKDEFKLAVGANGLLTSVNSTSKDETGAIILELAELAKQGLKASTGFAKLSSPVLPSDDEDERRRLCAKVLRKMSLTTEVNLSDVLRAGTSAGLAEQSAALNDRAVRAMQNMALHTPTLVQSMTFDTRPRAPLPGTISTEQLYIYPKKTGYSGVVFRLMAPQKFGVEMSTSQANFGGGCRLSSAAAIVTNMPVMVADPLRTFVVDNSRTAFVSKTIKMTVVDGVLTGLDVDKPSELLAAITVPVEVLKVIASIPAELLTIKVKQISDEKSLSAAQVDMLKLQIELIKQKQALLDAQAGTTPK